MRTIVEFCERENDLPLLRLYIHNAPHRRQDKRADRMVISRYREDLVAAAKASEIATPIKVPIAISILFINPTSPDLDNLILPLWRAMDGKAHVGRPTVLADDGLIRWIEKTGVYYPETKK